MFPSCLDSDRKQIVMTLSKLGIDSLEDIRLLEKQDIDGKLKVIHVRKLMEAAELARTADETEKRETKQADKASRDQTTRNLATATGILGAVGAAAIPLTIFAVLFPPITLPIAIAVGVGTGVVTAATAGTGIATAVMAHKNKSLDEAEEDEQELNESTSKLQMTDDGLKKLL